MADVSVEFYRSCKSSYWGKTVEKRERAFNAVEGLGSLAGP